MSNETKNCLFPTCRAHPEKNGYCVYHRIYASGAEVKTLKEIPKRTDTQKEINKLLKQAYPLYLAKKKHKCEIKSPVCTSKATVINHTRGRGKDHVLDESTWQASCSECNLWVEANHAKGEALGAKKTRHSKN